MAIEFGIALSRVGGVREQAQSLEAMGFDYLAVGEHVRQAGVIVARDEYAFGRFAAQQVIHALEQFMHVD